MTNNLCICSWPDCTTLRDKIREIAPASHVWCKPNIRIQFSSCDVTELSIKKYALRKAILKHIPIRSTLCTSSQKNLFLAPHHFLICLLQWRVANNVVAFTKLLSLSDISTMDDSNHDSHYLKEECNSAKKLMRKHHAYDTDKYKNMYVQTPCNTRSAVTIFLSSSRRHTVVRTISTRANNTTIARHDGDNISSLSHPTQDYIVPIRLDFNTTPPFH